MRCISSSGSDAVAKPRACLRGTLVGECLATNGRAAVEVRPQRRAESLPQRAEGDPVDGADLVDDPADRVGEATQVPAWA